jgi:hypothetical protein
MEMFVGRKWRRVMWEDMPQPHEIISTPRMFKKPFEIFSR